MPLRLIVLGPPGSGKSTLTRSLREEMPYLAHFAVRAFFTREIERNTDLGKAAKPFTERRVWLPDELVVEPVRRKLSNGEFDNGFVVEGMPGNLRQASLLDGILRDENLPLTAVLYIEAPDDICVARAGSRRVCTVCDGGVNQALIDQTRPDLCSICMSPLTVRPDDHEEAFRQRLSIHRAAIEDILGYYPSKEVIRLNGLLSAPEVFASATAGLNVVMGESHAARQ